MTDAEIEKVPEGPHNVGPNLFVQFRGGGRSWLVQWYRGSRVTTIGLGSCRDVKLEDAQRSQDLAMAMVRAGIDPRETRDIVAMRFEQPARDYLAEHEGRWRDPRHGINRRPTRPSHATWTGHFPTWTGHFRAPPAFHIATRVSPCIAL